MLLAWKIMRKYKIENYVVIHMPVEIARDVWYVTEKSGGKHGKVCKKRFKQSPTLKGCWKSH